MLGVLLLFIVVRAALAIWTWGVRQAFPDTFPGDVTDLYKGVLLETNPWLEPWQRWDTPQYQAIAGRGYAAFETALFTPPLYPFLMRIAGPFFGGDTLAFGLFISGLAALLGLVGLYQMARFEFGNDQDALRAALFFAVFPTAVFLYAAYSESLFLAAGILCLYFTRRENWILTGLFGALAALTRMPGSLLVFVLAYAAWKAWRQGDRRCWIAVTLTGLGAVVYPAYVWFGLHCPPTDILSALNAPGGILTFPGLNLVERRAASSPGNSLRRMSSNWDFRWSYRTHHFHLEKTPPHLRGLCCHPYGILPDAHRLAPAAGQYGALPAGNLPGLPPPGYLGPQRLGPPTHLIPLLARTALFLRPVRHLGLGGVKQHKAKDKKQKGLARENRPGLNASQRNLPFDPHLVQIIGAELRANQTDAGNGNNNESAHDSKYDHGDLLSNSTLINAIQTISFHTFTKL